MNKFCGKCGTYNREGMNFCTKCGAPLNGFRGARKGDDLNNGQQQTQPQNQQQQPPYQQQPQQPFDQQPDQHPFQNQPSRPGDVPGYGSPQQAGGYGRKDDLYFDENAQRKKTSKAPLIIILSVVGLLLIAGVVFLLDILGVIRIPFIESMLGHNGGSQAVVETLAAEMPTEAVIPTAVPTQPAPTASPKVKVTDGINRNAQDVKSDMESLGLQVKIVEQDNDTVEKGMVISQDIEPGTLVEPGTLITLYVSKGAAANKSGFDQKLVVRQTSGSSATAEFFEWENGSWVSKAKYKAVVGDNGVGEAGEGSMRTPEGVFKLGIVLSEYKPNSKMQWYKASSDTIVVDDTGYPDLYNQIMEKSSVPSGCSTDPTGRNLTDGTLNAVIYIEHNGDGFSRAKRIGGGSAIGLRGVYSMRDYTYGDVDISASDMEDLLSRLDPAKNPHIEIHSN